MRRLRNLVFYTSVLLCCVAAVYIVVQLGSAREIQRAGVLPSPQEHGYWQQFKITYHENLTHPLAILLLQILTIIITARVFGFVFGKLGLPSVVGEIAAGIFLGPSFLAHHWPEYSAFLFPAISLPNLQFLSQIGLILFMFVVGMELDLDVLKDRARDALVVSHSSIATAFAGGAMLAYFLFDGFAPANVHFLSFALFLGVAMSIAAFPVMARIVQERRLNRTAFGSMVLTFAAADDITAWCLLAVVIAVVKAGSLVSSLYTVLMAMAYVLVMLRVVRPFMRKLGDVFADRDSLSKPVVAVFFVVLLVSAYTAEVIGIHALFGAFVAGVVMPPNIKFRSIFIDKVEDVALVLLLPLFFVFTGLRTQIGLLDNIGLWKWCAVIVAVAIAGKFLGSALSARFVGLAWRESLMVGALMNTRGLMELVVLNIGYDLGVLSPQIFAMMVIMALVTTLLAGPLLSAIERFFPAPATGAATAQERARMFRVLVPFGDPERGRSMVRVALAFTRRNTNASVTALHLVPSTELHQFNLAEREKDSFKSIRDEYARRSGEGRPPVETLFKPSNDITRDVEAIANAGGYDLAIIGVGRSIYEGTLLGRIAGITSRIIDPERLVGALTGKEKLLGAGVFDDRVRELVREIKVPLGIYVEKGLASIDRVVIPLFTLSDSFLLAYAQKLIANNGSSVVLLDTANVFDQSPEMLATIEGMQRATPGRITMRRSVELESSLAELDHPDLMLIGVDAWTRAVEGGSAWLSRTPSVLIMRP
jgi:Kef-type K+ transport system membrane component KefB